MSPAIPILFGLYRFWQLSRGLWLLHLPAAAGGLAAPIKGWLSRVLRYELLFWSFDWAVVLAFLPWTYDWARQRRGPEKAD